MTMLKWQGWGKMLVLDYDLICAHILLPFVRDTRPQPLLSHFTLDTIHLYTILFYAVEWSGKSVGWVCAAGGQEDLGLGVWDWRLKGQQLERWHSHWNEKGQSGWKFTSGKVSDVSWSSKYFRFHLPTSSRLFTFHQRSISSSQPPRSQCVTIPTINARPSPCLTSDPITPL